MDTKALRQKILDLAIRGKLVPQDPNDEPASVLLERIREQKQQMVKEGKLKKKDIKNDSVIFVGEDNLHYEKFADGSVKCIEDEIPFELPEGWAWSRLGTISSAIQYGLSNSAEAQGSHKLLRITDIQDGTVNWDNVPFTTTTDPDTYLLKTGDIVFARTGATVGKSFLISETPFPAVYASYLIRIRLIGDLPSEYIYQFFNSACYWSQITDKSVGVGQPNCNGTSLKELFIPLPPLNEQVKIIPIVETLLDYVKRIRLERTELFSILSATKSKILDLAIRGQLVPQNPDDEPASVLLERIRAEKEEFIKQGKIKRDKKESIIFKGEDNSYYEKIGSEIRCIDGEIPFDLPDGWNWVRLKTICSKIIDGSHNPPKGSDEKTPYIMASSRNISFDTVTDLENVRYLNDKDFEKENSRSQLTINDILLTTVATLGRSCIYNGFPENLCFQRSVTVITTSILPQYLKIFFDASYFQDFIINNATGTAQKGFYLNQLESVLVCVPPAKEQNRLTTKIQQMLSGIQNIEKSLN